MGKNGVKWMGEITMLNGWGNNCVKWMSKTSMLIRFVQ